MRTFGFRTHVLVAVAGAIGVLAALARPWYAAAPTIAARTDDTGDLDGPLRALFNGISRTLSARTGATGWETLGTWGQLLGVVAGLAGVMAVLCLVPSVQGVARELLRYLALGAAAIAIWKLVDQPGPNVAMELRYGAWVGAVSALLLAWAGLSLAAAPLRR